MWNILKCRQLTQCRIISKKYFANRQPQQIGSELRRNVHCSLSMHSNDDSKTKNQNRGDIAPNIATKYERFTEDNATIILDMEEEREKLQDEHPQGIEVVDDSASDIFQGLNTERKQLQFYEYFLFKSQSNVFLSIFKLDFQVAKPVYSTLKIWWPYWNVTMRSIYLYVLCQSTWNMWTIWW